jgi:predicted kinase
VATLTVIGGLPGTGKSTVSVVVAKRTGAAFIRVDRIEHAIASWSTLAPPIGPAGYAVAHAVALEQLELGLDVIVECVNPSSVTRDAWTGTASLGSADLLEIELVCSDEHEHERRVIGRNTDVEGLVKPTWAEVLDRNYEPWGRDHLVIDTARTTPDDAAEQIISAMSPVPRL